jgi:hypothetical protein
MSKRKAKRRHSDAEMDAAIEEVVPNVTAIRKHLAKRGIGMGDYRAVEAFDRVLHKRSHGLLLTATEARRKSKIKYSNNPAVQRALKVVDE